MSVKTNSFSHVLKCYMMFAAICGYGLTLQHTEPLKWSDQGNQNSHDLKHLSFIFYFENNYIPHYELLYAIHFCGPLSTIECHATAIPYPLTTI